MATYPVINKETGETKELIMSMKEYDIWNTENPDWDKDWSKGCATAGEVGDWQNKLIAKNPGWNEVLGRAASMPGAAVTKI